jgi:photosystem II stability/assembly factor-like uncharacterized protein
MKSDALFEREVRASLRASAAGQAPDELVARIGEIPSREPSPRAGVRGLRSVARLAVNLAAAAVVVIAVAALIVSRNGGNLPAGGQPTGSGSVATPGASAATPAASAMPSAASSPTAPSAAIAAPSATPPVASTSPVPTATPSASTSLLGLSPASVTFVSPDDGWVLGTGTCSSAPCAAIARTADGGRTWAKVSAPHASIVPGGDQGPPGISGLRFADARNGWAFGPDLWATHDGGASWARLTIPGLPADAAIVALASANGKVHAAVLDGQDYRVASSPVGADDFRLSAVRVPVGAGPVPSVQLVLSRSAGWLIENDRTVVGGARLVNGAWVAWQPPCADVVGPAFLAASSPTELAAACDVGLWGTPTGDHLYVSHDGGSTFVESGAAVPLTTAAQVASASPSVIVVGGSDATGAVLVATFDGGRTWTIVARLGAVSIADLGFTTTAQGVVITAPAGGPASLLMTRDGGRTWAAVGTAGG